MKRAAWIITVASVIHTLGYLYGLPASIGEPGWSTHEQFHLNLAWFWGTGLDIAVIALAWGPMQRMERWAFWPILLGLITAHGGHFIASLLVPAGRHPEWWYDYALGTVGVIYAIGLWLAWRAYTPTAAQPARPETRRDITNAAVFIILSCLIQIGGYAYALPEHLGDPTWSQHAQFHHELGWLWLLGLNVALIALAWIPLRRQERWALWPLLAGLVFGQSAHFIALLLYPEGASAGWLWWFNPTLALQAVIYAGGLALAWRALPAKR